jgi:hypothetical protein
MAHKIRIAAMSLWRVLFDNYRPERHYMRGPGPKWRAKHGAERVTRAFLVPAKVCKTLLLLTIEQWNGIRLGVPLVGRMAPRPGQGAHPAGRVSRKKRTDENRLL